MAVQGVAHLRDLLELIVGLTALLSCLQSDFIVIHKRFVYTKLAGLQKEESGEREWEGERELMNG